MSHQYSHRRIALEFIGFIVLAIGIVAAVTRIDTIQNYLSRASGQPANLIIDTQGVIGPLPTPWRYLAQGGESTSYSFAPAAAQITAQKPQYIRIDHLFDFYHVVQSDGSGAISYSFSQLDPVINQITQTGALPFLSLSYLPPAFSSTGDVTGTPRSYQDWTNLVKATIEHVSGKTGLNLTNVYYEVWNEPDLFGQFKTYGDKNYLDLYQASVKGAQNAQNTQPFFIGGPATTSLYPNWLTRFMDFVDQNHLRLDFYSWHIYDPNPQTYVDQLKQFDSLMRRYPDYLFKIEPIITEWGPSAAIDQSYDGDQSAAHLVAVNAMLPPALKKAFIFEIQDGESPSGNSHWGRWGLLTSPKSGGQPKPRYHALTKLNQLGDQKISLIGQGTWVKAIASRDTVGAIKIIVTNYDPENRHTETVPIAFKRLTGTNYTLTIEFLNRQPQSLNLTAVNGTLTHNLPLATNTIALITLKPQ